MDEQTLGSQGAPPAKRTCRASVFPTKVKLGWSAADIISQVHYEAQNKISYLMRSKICQNGLKYPVGSSDAIIKDDGALSYGQ